MARAVYSVTFMQIAGLDGRHDYVVPSGFRAVVRDIDVFAHVSVAARDIHIIGQAGQTFYWFDWNTGDTSAQHWSGRVVLDPGSLLRAQSSDLVDVTISGYLLTLP